MFGLLNNVSFIVIVCLKAENIEDNEVDLDASSMKKSEKVKQKNLPSEASDGGDIVERQRLINYIFSEGYDKRNYPTNMTVQLGVALIKIDVVS